MLELRMLALRSRRISWAWLAALLFWATAGPATAQRSDKTFEESTSVVVVEVPVNVVKDGKPVRGLTAENFEITDGRKKRPLTAFEVIDLAQVEASAVGQQRVPLAARRHFLFLFDLSFSDPQSVLKARQAALEVARNGLHPQDLAAVAMYTLRTGPSILLGFTPDRKQLELAIDTLGAPELVIRGQDPLQFTLTEQRSSAPGPSADAGNPGTGVRADVDQAVLEHLESITDAVRTADRRAAQTQVENLTAQLGEMAKLLASVQGRKHVLYLSEGFDNSLLVGEGSSQRNADLIATGESYFVDTDAMYGSGDVQNSLQAMLQEFRRADCVIQSIDIGGAQVGGTGRAAGDQSLVAMASDTGGEFYDNFNDLNAAMGQMLDKTSVTYLLAFQPDDLKLDGEYHRLKVKLKDAPRGARVQHRPGYFAPKPLGSQQLTERRLTTAERLLGEDGGDFQTAVLAAPFAVTGGKPYVPLLVEVEGEGLLAGSQAPALPAEIFAYALDQNGSVHDFFAHTLPLNLQQAGAQVRASGLKYYGHFDLDPGRYTVRVLVRNGETGRSSLRVVDLQVPDFGKGEPVVLPPLFPETPGRWVMLREEARRQRDVPFPFMLGEQAYLPAAAPALPGKKPTRFSMAAYHLGDGRLEVSGRLIGEDGMERKGAKVSLEQRLATGSPGEEILVLSLEPRKLPPGTYTLEVRVRATDSGADAFATTLVEIAEREGNLMQISQR